MGSYLRTVDSRIPPDPNWRDLMTATAPAAACHAMLLRLAGHVPDDLLTCCRRWLADGRVELDEVRPYSLIS